MDWFKKWFNSPEYLELYSHRNSHDAAQIASLIYRNLRLPEKSKVLDLACGNGRHSVFFAKQGYKVLGMDLSKYLISEARKKIRNEYSIYHDNLTFRIKDMREIGFNNEFDLVVNLFSSFGYFENDNENWKVIKSVASSLKLGGYFFFDYLNSLHLRNHLVPYDVKQRNRNVMVQVREIKGDCVLKHIIIIRNKTRKPAPEVTRFTEKIKLYTLEDFERVFEKNGLSILKLFGDYLGGRYKKASSSRLIILARKET